MGEDNEVSKLGFIVSGNVVEGGVDVENGAEVGPTGEDAVTGDLGLAGVGAFRALQSSPEISRERVPLGRRSTFQGSFCG